MSFLSPLFLAGAAFAAIPIVIHLLKREPDARVRFSAVALLRHAPVEHAARRRLRELILLALRVAGLLLLAFAFARPFFNGNVSAAQADVTVVALDTSLSMSAPGQFEKARQLATARVDQARGLVAIVTFADSAQVLSELSADRSLARAAIANATAGYGGTRYRAALNAAADVAHGRGGSIVVVTDLQQTGWDSGDRVQMPEALHVEVADVGAPPPDFAISGARLAGDRIVATVRNTATAARDAHVSLNVGNAGDLSRSSHAADTTVPVGPNATADVTFSAPRARWASVTVDDGQGIQGDNVRYLVLDTTARPKVLVISPSGDLGHEAFYVQQALVAAGADGGAYEVEGVGGPELQTWDQARMDSHPAVVLMSTRGLEHHGRALVAEYVRRGGGVFIAGGDTMDGEVLSESLGGAKISVAPPAAANVPNAPATRALAPLDVRHPVLEAFAGRSSLGLITFRRVSAVRANGCQPLARFTTGETALFDCEVDGGRVLLLAFDLDNQGNDFPLHATFVPFVHEAIQYLSGGRRSAEYVLSQAPAGLPKTPGIAATGAAGAAARIVALNVDPGEADPGRLTSEEFKAAVSPLQGRGDAAEASGTREREERQHVWQYVLALMVVTLIVESAVATRTA